MIYTMYFHSNTEIYIYSIHISNAYIYIYEMHIYIYVYIYTSVISRNKNIFMSTTLVHF